MENSLRQTGNLSVETGVMAAFRPGGVYHGRACRERQAYAGCQVEWAVAGGATRDRVAGGVVERQPITSSHPAPDVRGSRAHVLMYHGIHDDREALGRVHAGRSYSVSLAAFESQMRAIDQSLHRAPSLPPELGLHVGRERFWAITFDDGMDSVLPAVEVLDSQGWHAHFFIVSEWIGKPGFLSPDHLLDLRSRGHVIGSHSLSHPDRMSRLSYPRLLEQWQRSSEDLGSILGERIRVAAVPGGSYSSEVAAAASEAGIEFLFTSEPISHVHRVQGCTVIGRYAIRNSTEARLAAALATGELFACGAQWAGWNTKKVAKKVLGTAYHTMRAKILDARAEGQG